MSIKLKPTKVKLSMGEGEKAIMAFRDEILASWETRVRAYIKPLRYAERIEILNGMPPFLELLSKSMSFRLAKDDFLAMAEVHGIERSKVEGMTPVAIRNEYEFLRDCIYSKLGDEQYNFEDLQQSIEEFLDKAATVAVQTFIKATQPKI